MANNYAFASIQFIHFFFLNNWLNGFDDCFWILKSMWWLWRRQQQWLWCCFAYRQCIINQEEAANLYNGLYQCTVCESLCDALFVYKLLMCEWWTMLNPNRMKFSTNHDNRASQSISHGKHRIKSSVCAHRPNNKRLLISIAVLRTHFSLSLENGTNFNALYNRFIQMGVWMQRGISIVCAYSKQHLRMLSTWGTTRRWFLWWEIVHSKEYGQWI